MNGTNKSYSDLKGNTIDFRVDNEHSERWFLTNPSRIFKVEDTYYMLVREQLKLKYKLEDLPGPGRSQVGLYMLDGELNSERLEFSRVKTLSTGSDDYDWKEDPAISRVNGDWIVTIVSCTPPPMKKGEGPRYPLRTYFYRLNERTLELEEPFFIGPEDMKDIRLFELPNGKIAVLTRPRGMTKGKHMGRGHIGYFEVDTFDDLTKDQLLGGKDIFHPMLFEDAYPEIEEEFGTLWVGSNDVLSDENGKIIVDDKNNVTVFSHIGSKEPGPYLSFCFELNLDSLALSNIRYLADITNFGDVEDGNIRPNTVFTGGACMLNDKEAIVTAGLNDVFAGFFTVGVQTSPVQESDDADDLSEEMEQAMSLS